MTNYLDTLRKGNDTAAVTQYLFDSNTNNAGKYKGLLLCNSVGSYWEIAITKNIKIYAYGHSYGDAGGSSGKNVIFKKYDGSSYVDYITCGTNASGSKYQLVELEPGRYRMYAAADYVNFDEWEIEIID